MNTGETFWILIEDCNGNYLYYSDMIVIRPSFQGRECEDNDSEVKMEEEYHLSYQIFLDKNKNNNNSYDYDDDNDDDIVPTLIFVRAIADRWLHSETCISISLERLILPSKHQEYTELLDLKPISILKGFSDNKSIHKYLEKMFCVVNINESNLKLNSIQTQLFNLIYNSDKSFYLSSPPGNGQFICTCMGILRELKIHQNLLNGNFQVLILECNSKKINYIGYKLINIFGNSAVGILSENNDINDEIVSKKPIVVSNIYNWDRISKRLSKVREIIKSLKLLVINGLEYIFNNNNINDEYSGYAIESTISRLRYIITPLNLNIRVFGYSKCISNACEVSEWLGIKRENTFSFDQNIFNDNIEKRVIGFDSYYRSTRLQMMLKYIKEQILNLKVKQGKKETLLIYVLEYEFCLSISNELLSFISENAFINSNIDNNVISSEKNSLLEKCLISGIGYLYKIQPEIEKEYVVSQYNSGKICILIVCEDMKNSINLKFNRVIVMDTKKIDQDDNMGSSVINFSDRRTVEYSHLDIHQMMSRCYYNVNNKFDYNSRSSFTLLCSTSKHEFYEYILEHTLPLESSIDDGIIDCINTEIALRTIKTKQDTIDWITWTLYYRRISKVSLNEKIDEKSDNTISRIKWFLRK
ncbi:hypothetical protein FG386_000195 [Cryptosporidium ryanae]|uniref:uncharacterized protein n=1 Tax=Cryptosporidium ryanae TaxID=515981 RepID=UPI00351A2BF3|nr:hypothetical protein FG386_000195 [Cryptosporidium ryanae]